jgi:tRNA pseudouridine38-40 synthase
MPQRLRLIISYDGSHFAGWQSQKHGNTVQDHLERVFGQIAGAPIRVHGAGRTDAGVHALAQCAHVDLGTNRLSPSQWVAALNSALPPQLRVLRCQRVSDDFHARFSATGKVYQYRIWSGPILPPLQHGRVWHLHRALDFSIMETAAAKFVGRHDFAGFAANRGHSPNNTVRNIRSIALSRSGSLWKIQLDGDGFLYKMARLMVGALTECASARLTVEELIARIERPQNSGPRLAAPAEGLYLVRVRY